MWDKITEFLWSAASSTPVLSIVALLLVAALVVGYFPLLKLVPVLGQYVPVARICSLAFTALLFFLTGIHVDMERHETVALRNELNIAKLDLSTTTEAATAASEENAELLMKGQDDAKRIEKYKNDLSKARANCVLTPDDFRVR